jgi:hypothetical protein
MSAYDPTDDPELDESSKRVSELPQISARWAISRADTTGSGCIEAWPINAFTKGRERKISISVGVSRHRPG